jgi:hypothetical protein
MQQQGHDTGALMERPRALVVKTMSVSSQHETQERVSRHTEWPVTLRCPPVLTAERSLAQTARGGLSPHCVIWTRAGAREPVLGSMDAAPHARHHCKVPVSVFRAHVAMGWVAPPGENN